MIDIGGQIRMRNENQFGEVLVKKVRPRDHLAPVTTSTLLRKGCKRKVFQASAHDAV